MILACSQRKRQVSGPVPAIQPYDGVSFRVRKRRMPEVGWPPGLIITTRSEKYGLVDAADIVQGHDLPLDPDTSAAVASRLLATHETAWLQSLYSSPWEATARRQFAISRATRQMRHYLRPMAHVRRGLLNSLGGNVCLMRMAQGCPVTIAHIRCVAC
jgi:hypothetical protein